MSRTILSLGTGVLLAAAALLWWITEQMLIAIYAGSPVWGVCLLIAGASVILAIFFLVAAIANFVDLIDVTFGGARAVRQ